MPEKDWAAEVIAIETLLDEVLDTLRTAPAGARDTELCERLSQIKDRQNSLYTRLVYGPVATLASGVPLSREQYHLVASRGRGLMDNQKVGLSPYTDFEVDQFFFYEDADHCCRIDTSERPAPGFVRIRIGKYPEELRIDALRPEQRRFFEQHLPHVAARFCRGNPGADE